MNDELGHNWPGSLNFIPICAAPTGSPVRCYFGQSKMETKPVPVYLIDAIAWQVVDVPYDGSLKRLYELIDCHCIDYTDRLPNSDGLYCTDLLMSHNKPPSGSARLAR